MHFQLEQRPVSLLQISLIWMKTCIASHCLWAVTILKYLLCLIAGFLWLFSIWTHSCSHFFDWQLVPAGLLSDLVTVDAYWLRLKLLTDSRHTSPETQTQIWIWLRQLPHSTQVVYCPQTVHCWLHLISQQLQQLSHDNTHKQAMLPTIFQETTQSEQHWHSDAERLYL